MLLFDILVCAHFIFILLANLNRFGDSQKIICLEEHQKFLCDNNKCIHQIYVCDGDDDCQDGSDERGCATRPCNDTIRFRCANGLCVDRLVLCDGINQCKDNSDEKNCSVCPKDKFQCDSDQRCVFNAWKCDGSDDCGDNSDEQDCPVKTCPENQFFCDYDCLDIAFRCDGELDCLDESDEQNCTYDKCPDDKFQCTTSKQCLPNDFRCDKFDDCDDGSDEIDCGIGKPDLGHGCPEGHRSCGASYGHITQCILPSMWCDGDYDCSNEADEHGCPPRHCKSDDFACSPHHCIPLERRCDGIYDCIDSSDEMNCPSKEENSDCDPSHSFACAGNSKCISKSRMCDGKIDCVDGSDEVRGINKCFYNECNDTNGGCSDICVDSHFSFSCSCFSGFKLDVDGRTCIDINECESQHDCEQDCVNSKGSYHCKCYQGYQMTVHGKCKAVDSSGTVGKDIASLVFSNKFDIRRIMLERSDAGFMSVIASKLHHAAGLALDVKKRLVFWTDSHKDEDESIYSLSMNQSQTGSRVFSTNVRKPVGLSVDWVNDLLYWTEADSGRVSASYIDGSHPTPVVSSENLSFKSIVVHPGRCYIFVIAFQLSNASIRRYDMDGENGQDVITDRNSYPTGLTIDYEESRLFWIDKMRHSLSSSDFSGKSRTTVLQIYNNLRLPRGIALLFDRVYWTDHSTRQLQSCNKWNGKDIAVVDSQLLSPYELQVDHPRAQPDFLPYCSRRNCDFLCLPSLTSAKNYTCACPFDYRLDARSGECIKQTDTSNDNRTVEATAAPSAGPQALIAAVVIGCVVMLTFAAFVVRRTLKRRTAQRYINFDNPIYRKPTAENRKDVNHPPGVPRNASQMELIQEQIYASGDGNLERTDSQDSESPNTSNEHVYSAISSVPTEEDMFEPSVDIPDKRSLVS